MKQCPNCKGNIADFVAVCPYCGAAAAPVAPMVPVPSQPVWAGPPQNSGKALASLICSLVFFLWPFSSLAAVILGHVSLSEIKRSAGRITGQGLAIAGLVLGYIGVTFGFLIVAAIAIPNLLRARMAANEASAVGALRTYNTAMVAYSAACPDIGYPQSLENLGPGSRDCQHLDVVDVQLGAQFPVKNGYRFYYERRGGSSSVVNRYVLAADPVTPGTTGMRHFFTDETGVIRFSVRGAADAHSPPLQ
jgi:type IV pilus assembly protein PilA